MRLSNVSKAPVQHMVRLIVVLVFCGIYPTPLKNVCCHGLLFFTYEMGIVSELHGYMFSYGQLMCYRLHAVVHTVMVNLFEIR